MDISLLSKMIGELIMKYDQVGLPGIGTFVAEMVPASFSDKGYTINPPYRRLNFYPARLEEDVLADFYSETNGVDIESARNTVNRFLSEMRVVLIDRRTVVLPGLGRLRATKENNVFFVPDENLDIFPDGYGLPAISLKTHVESRDEISMSVSELASMIRKEKPEAENPIEFDIIPEGPQPDPEPAPQPVPEPAPEPAPKPILEPAPIFKPEPKPEPEPQPKPEPEPELEPELISPPKQKSNIMPRRSIRPEFRPEPKQENQFEALFSPEKGAGPQLEPEPRHFRWWVLALILLGVAFVALCTFVILAALAPDFIDSILYTPEELQIINF